MRLNTIPELKTIERLSSYGKDITWNIDPVQASNQKLAIEMRSKWRCRLSR
jgi:hypothetical protein